MGENKKPNNPNAFPFAAEYGHPAACGGMTLRDYYAEQALQGLYANPGTNDWDEEKYAIESYLAADAMLKQREL